jgi:hypothetical protein
MGSKASTFVMSVVAASISCSSAVRSEKPGRACFACSFSRAVTGTCTSILAVHF